MRILILTAMTVLAGCQRSGDMANKYPQFNNFDAAINVEDGEGLHFGNEPFTICMCIMPSVVPFVARPILREIGTHGLDIQIQTIENDNAEADMLSVLLYNNVLGAPEDNGTWYHWIPQSAFTVGKTFLVIVRTDTEILFYVNAQPVVATVGFHEGNPSITVDVVMQIKNLWPTGGLDDLRFYKKALTAAEVAAIYNNGKGTKYTGAAAEGGLASAAFNMDEGAGNTITDAVGGLVGTFSETGVSWALGGVPFVKARSHARKMLK